MFSKMRKGIHNYHTSILEGFSGGRIRLSQRSCKTSPTQSDTTFPLSGTMIFSTHSRFHRKDPVIWDKDKYKKIDEEHTRTER
jgi:hypothetical protein